MGYATIQSIRETLVRRTWDVDVPELFPEGAEDVTLCILEPLELQLFAAYQAAVTGSESKAESHALLIALLSEVLCLVVVHPETKEPLFAGVDEAQHLAMVCMKTFTATGDADHLHQLVVLAFRACDIDIKKIVEEKRLERLQDGEKEEAEEEVDKSSTDPFGVPLPELSGDSPSH